MDDRTQSFQTALELVESLPISEQIDLIGIIQNRLREDSKDASINWMKLKEIDRQLELIVIVQDRLRERYREELIANSKLTEEDKAELKQYRNL